MTEIKTAGRTDLDALFKQSGCLDGKLTHHPFLAFVDREGVVTVEVVTSAETLSARYAPNTPVMVQWGGQWSSDFFQMTVADVTAGLDRRRRSQEREASPNCSVCDTPIDGGHYPREDELGWLKVCRACVASYDAEHPRPNR